MHGANGEVTPQPAHCHRAETAQHKLTEPSNDGGALSCTPGGRIRMCGNAAKTEVVPLNNYT